MKKIDVPLFINVRFQQRGRLDSQLCNNDAFDRSLVSNAQCLMRTDKEHDDGLYLNYLDDEYSQNYTQFIKVFGCLAKDDILRSNMFDHVFRSSNLANSGIQDGYNHYLFDIQYRKISRLLNQFK